MLKKNSKTIPKKSKNGGELAKNLAERIDEKRGYDIVIFDLRNMSPITDYYVIASGLSEMHNHTIADYLMECEIPNHIEGLETGTWILLDFFDVIVHIFSKPIREFYGLERLWGDAPRIEVNHD